MAPVRTNETAASTVAGVISLSAPAASSGPQRDGNQPAVRSATDSGRSTVGMAPPRRRSSGHDVSSLCPSVTSHARSLRGPGGLERGVEREPAVDEHGLPGDVGGLVGEQESGDRRHLLGVAGSPHRDVALDHLPLDGGVDPGAVDRGDRGAGADAVHPDAAGGVLERERVGQVLHAALGHRVPDEPRLGDHLVDAGHVDDGTGLTGPQPRADGLLAAEERAPEVDRQDLVERGDGQFIGVRRDLDAGVVDEEVDAAVLAEGPLEHCADLVLLRHVGADEDRVRPGGGHLLHADVDAVLDGLPGLLGALARPDVVDGDVDALLTEPDGDRLADSGAAAGHQRLLALQTLHVVLLPVSTWCRPSVKKATASSWVVIRPAGATAPNGAFQKPPSDGGPSCGPTYRYGSAIASSPGETP